MLPTPSTSHVPYERVYEPAEDSFLVLDSVSDPTETAFLHDHFRSPTPGASGTLSPPPLILEIGTGSGVVLAFVHAQLHKLIGRSDALVLGIDVNHFACRATVETVNQASGASRGAFLGVAQCDLFSCLRPRSVDVVIFNPPYVPTECLPTYDSHLRTSETSFVQDSNLLELSYAGGEDGMQVTNRFLEELDDMLSARGVAYLLLCAQNKPEGVKSRIKKWGDGWDCQSVRSSGKQAGWEKLQVLRIWRSN